MKIDLIPSVSEVRTDNLLRRTVIMIDVLRASSTIVTAFIAGCTYIVPVETTGQAFALKDQDTLLIGERFTKKINGFDYNNSPTEISQLDLQNKRIVLTTTNGTRALYKAQKGEVVLIGSFLNGKAIAQKTWDLKQDVLLFCAGTREEFALEDGLCAGYIIDELYKIDPNINCSDLAKIAHAAYLKLQDQLYDALCHSTTGKRLINLNLDAEINYCAQINMTSLVPFLRENRIFVQHHS